MSTTQPIEKVYFEDQIRSRERVRDIAEVYTHDREVSAMLDFVADMFPNEDDPENIDRTFLEPACGHGNFLVEIVRRKISAVKIERYASIEDFEYQLLRCFTSTYGIDIDEGNVVEARERMFAVLDKHVHNAGVTVSLEFLDAVSAVLGTNVQQADTLAEAEKIKFVEYKPVDDACFVREWSYLEEDEGPVQLDLFDAPPAVKCNEAPVHYTHLASRIAAVVA